MNVDVISRAEKPEQQEKAKSEAIPTGCVDDSRAATLDCRTRFLSPSLKTFQAYEQPLILVRGEGQYLWDESGKKYLDCLGQNLCISVGYNNKRVTEAVIRQAQTLQHVTTMFFNPLPAQLAKKLIDWMPEGEDWVVHFVNSGAEAVDLAVQMARCYTGNHDVLALRNSFHGLHGVGQAVTGMSICRQPIPALPGFIHVMHPDAYRGAFGNDTQAYISEYANSLAFGTSGRVAATVIEPIQGFGGVVPMPAGYLDAVFDLTRKAGGVCIADEIQTGFGRTGEHRWGFQDHGVIPDIALMAKSIGNGYPLAAVVVKRDIAQAFSTRKFFNTYGSNLVACAAGLAVLEEIEARDLQGNAKRIGGQMMGSLKNLAQRWEIIGDVRGRGLMIGVELVRSRAGKEPADIETARIHQLLREEGIIVGHSGFYKNVLRICPPLILDDADAIFFSNAMNKAFERFDAER